MEHKTLDIEKLLDILIKRKIFIVLFTLFTSSSSLIYSYFLTPVYTSTAILETNPNLDSGNQISQFNGAASLIGLDIGGSSSSANIIDIALATLKSRDFFESLLNDEYFLAELMATKEYNPKSKEIIFDKKKFSEDQKSWLINGIDMKPSFHDSYEKYAISVIEVAHDEMTSMTTIKINHPSPVIAKKWLERIILDLNKTMREKKIEEASSGIKFLEEKLKLETITELKKAISNSIEKQLNILMVAEISEDYIFSYIDRPREPSIKSKPSKKNYLIFGFLLGAVFSVLLSLIAEFVSSYRLRKKSQ